MCFWCFHVSVTKSTSWWNSCFKIYVECDTHRPPTSVIRYHQLGNTTSSAIKCRHQHLNAFSDTLVNTPRATTRKISRSPTPRPEARIPKAKAILGIESQENQGSVMVMVGWGCVGGAGMLTLPMVDATQGLTWWWPAWWKLHISQHRNLQTTFRLMTIPVVRTLFTTIFQQEKL